MSCYLVNIVLDTGYKDEYVSSYKVIKLNIY